MRGLIAAVGTSWLLASSLPTLALLHQGLLAVALVVFPTGRPTQPAHWVLLGLAVPVGVGLLAQPGVAVLFVAIAAVTLARRPIQRLAWYPAGSALVVGLALAGSWMFSRLDPEAFDPELALVVYQTVLITIAIGFPIAARAVRNDMQNLVEVVLRDEPKAGLEGLATVLADALDDPGLEVYRWLGPEAGDRTATGTNPEDLDRKRHVLEIEEAGRPIAAVASNSTALSDPSTAGRVASAVRLTIQHLQLGEDLQTQLEALEAARRRLLAAADRQRHEVAVRLRKDTLTNLERAVTELRDLRANAGSGEAAATLEVAIEELDIAQTELLGLVSGIPSSRLGNGRLGAAIAELAGRSAVPVDVSVSADAAAGPHAETALFYVFSEALTNAVKHAAASRVQVTLQGEQGTLALHINDDGRGGADPTGSGLQGLSDRLAATGGRLRVVSPPGAGTTVTAVVPR
jgi:signal transduction histidine kinase